MEGGTKHFERVARGWAMLSTAKSSPARQAFHGARVVILQGLTPVETGTGYEGFAGKQEDTKRRLALVQRALSRGYDARASAADLMPCSECSCRT